MVGQSFEGNIEGLQDLTEGLQEKKTLKNQWQYGCLKRFKNLAGLLMKEQLVKCLSQYKDVCTEIQYTDSSSLTLT